MGAYSFDLTTRTVWWDARTRELFGVEQETVSLAEAMRPVHPDDRPAVKAETAAAVDPAGSGQFRMEYRVVLPDGGVRWLRSMGAVQFEPGGAGGASRVAVRLIGYLQDVTDAKREARLLSESNDRLEREVARRTDQLRTAAERLAEASRQERDRIAHVLHDHLQQILVGAKMNVAVLEATSAGENQEIAVRVSGLLQEAIEESRSLSAELSPPILRSAGLGPALDWLAQQFQERHGLTATIDWDPDASEPLDDSLAALLFGAARESLLNVIKHAGIGVARIRLTSCDCGPDCGTPVGLRAVGGRAAGGPGVLLTIADDGVGFDAPADDAPSGADNTAGFGMSDLRQRVDLLGGVVRVASAPGAGCTVAVCVPLPDANPPPA